MDFYLSLCSVHYVLYNLTFHITITLVFISTCFFLSSSPSLLVRVHLLFSSLLLACLSSLPPLSPGTCLKLFTFFNSSLIFSLFVLEVLHIGHQREELDIELEGKKLTQRDSFVYLGGAVCGDGKTEREVGRRAQAGANAWRAVEGVMADRRISTRLKGKKRHARTERKPWHRPNYKNKGCKCEKTTGYAK